MRKGRRLAGWMLIGLLLTSLPCTAQADEELPLADKIIQDMEALLRGKASVGVMEMYIARYDRAMKMKFWEVFPDKSLAKIVSPAEDAGKGTLKLGEELWTYDPDTDEVQKIPASLMLDGWMGSDFTNDDISRSSSISVDYVVGTPVEAEYDGEKTYRLPVFPRPESSIVWEKLVVEVTRTDSRPLRQEYYAEGGELARTMLFLDYKPLDDGRSFPHKWRIVNHLEGDRYTEMRMLKMMFKEELSDKIFSIRALKK